jgi:hypothetical protein
MADPPILSRVRDWTYVNRKRSIATGGKCQKAVFWDGIRCHTRAILSLLVKTVNYLPFVLETQAVLPGLCGQAFAA